MNREYDVIISPIVSENSMGLTAEKKYTFKVDFRANKYVIKDAIEKLFDVKVAKINTMNVKGKPKRQGRTSGYTSKWKKAIVTLTEDSKEIEIFEGL